MSSKENHSLTPQEITYLFDFTRHKRVRYYDLQVELVDHLASAIEEKQAAAPGTSFEQALDEVYRSFGITGFAHVVAAKERAIHRRAIREIGRFFRELLHPERLWIPLLIVSVFFVLYRFLPLSQLADGWIMVLALVLCLPVYFFSIRYFILSRRQTGRRFLILEMPNSLGIGASFGLFGVFYSWTELALSQLSGQIWLPLGLAIFHTLLWLYAYGVTVYLPRRGKEILREQFPALS